MSSSHGSSCRPSNRSERMKCICGLNAERRVSRSTKNPGKIYYNCPNFPKREVCSFFIWDNATGMAELGEMELIVLERTEQIELLRRNEELLQMIISDLRRDKEDLQKDILQLKMEKKHRDVVGSFCIKFLLTVVLALLVFIALHL